MNGISVFIKEIPAKRPIYKLGSGLSSDTGSYQHINSGLFSLSTVTYACLLFLSHPVYGIFVIEAQMN